MKESIGLFLFHPALIPKDVPRTKLIKVEMPTSPIVQGKELSIKSLTGTG